MTPAPGPPAGWFGPTAAPLEIDFGCHRGAFLLGMAALHPGVNFLGIEKQPDRVEKCNARAARLGLANAHAIQGLGAESLESLPPSSVAVFHLYFPDPWPKRRHASRRVFQIDFLAAIRRVLRPDGALRLMTDDEPYFREMRVLATDGWIETPWNDGRETVPTAFELTFRKLGKSPFCAALRQAPAA
jgi:tRNA (guanine-N7-)-methyltransferase